MNEAHLHLTLNHFPIITSIIGLLVLVLALSIRSEVTQRVACGIIILAASLAIPSYLTGEGAEEIVEELGISHDLIHEHEEIAEWYFRLMMLTGITALLSLFISFKRPKLGKTLSIITVFITLGAVIYSVKVYNSGGEIMHKEIRQAED